MTVEHVTRSDDLQGGPTPSTRAPSGVGPPKPGCLGRGMGKLGRLLFSPPRLTQERVWNHPIPPTLSGQWEFRGMLPFLPPVAIGIYH